MQVRSTIAHHPKRFVLVGVVLVGVLAAGVYWFGPQYLFIDRRVNDR